MAEPAVYEVSFRGASIAEGNRQAQLLREQILRASSDVEVELRKEQEGTQDLGSIVQLALQPELITAVAGTIASFLARNRKVEVEIETPNGTFRAGGLDPSDARHLAELMLSGSRDSA